MVPIYIHELTKHFHFMIINTLWQFFAHQFKLTAMNSFSTNQLFDTIMLGIQSTHTKYIPSCLNITVKH